MKVMILGNYSRNLVVFRGAVIRELVRRGHEVLAVGPEQDAWTVDQLTLMGARFECVPMARSSLNPWRDFVYMVRIVLLARRYPAQAILTYTHKPNTFGILAASLLRPRPAIVQLIEGLGYAFINIEGFRKRLANHLVKTLYRLSFKLSSKVFFLNEDDLGMFQEKGLLARGLPVEIIDGIGVDLLRFRPSLIPAASFTFLMIARLLRTKGVAEFCDAAQQVRHQYPEVLFVLVGAEDLSRDGFPCKELQRYIDAGTVQWIRESNEVECYYNACSAYVLPSYREGLPVTIMEAMASGRPVITTDVPGCRTTVTDGLDGLIVPSKNVDALAKAMIRLLQSPVLVQELGTAARRTAVRRFDTKVLSARQADSLEHYATNRGRLLLQ